MRRLSVLPVLALIFFAAAIAAQEASRTVTLTTDAPVFTSPNADQTPLRIGKAGSVLRLLSLNAEWCQVEFNDPDLGRRTGYVQTKNVQTAPVPLAAPIATAQGTATLSPPQQPSRQAGDSSTGYSASAGLGSQSRPALSDADVDQLIVLGRANKLNDVSTHCTAVRTSIVSELVGVAVGEAAGAAIQAARNRGTEKFSLTAMGPRGWIATNVWDKARTNATIARTDIPIAWREPAIYVVIEPVFPKPDSKAEPTIPLAVTTITLKDIPINQNRIPLEYKPIGEPIIANRTWKSAAGATVDYKQITFRFDPTSLAALEVEFVNAIVTTDAGQRACEISAGALRKFAKEGRKK